MLPQTVSVAGLGNDGQRLADAWQAHGISVQRTLADAVIAAPVVMLDMEADQCLPFLERYGGRFEQGTVICDIAALKQPVVYACEAFCRERGLHYLGGHFLDGQFIFTPTENTAPQALQSMQALAVAAGCLCVFTTPEEHDARMAYTEQLSRLLAAVYVQNETAYMHRGFSAAACRTAACAADNEAAVWAKRMMSNRQLLREQIGQVCGQLEQLQQTLQNGSAEQLAAFLRDAGERYRQYFQ